MDEALGNQDQLDARDRGFIIHLVQGVQRWRLRLDWIIGQAVHFPLRKITPRNLNILRLALYQIYFMDKVPESAAVNEAVKQVKVRESKHVVSFVNGVLRNICRNKDDFSFPDPKKDPIGYLSTFFSYPEWLVKKWTRELGKDTAQDLLEAGNRVPKLIVRTNTLKINRTALIERLKQENVVGIPTPKAPDGIFLEGLKGRIDGLNTFREGLLQVQGQATQLMSHLLAPQPRDSVLDVCAGLGGKAGHMAELMQGRGNVLALDISARRLIDLARNSERLGIHNIDPVVADAAFGLSSLIRCRFDGIMVDAPCSGLGVLSRHPDGKWNRDVKDIKRLARLQKTILKGAASVLKKGGRMLYVTCTISKEENEEVVEDCLERNKDLESINLAYDAPVWARPLVNREGFFQSYPHIHEMDGLFAALFTKS